MSITHLPLYLSTRYQGCHTINNYHVHSSTPYQFFSNSQSLLSIIRLGYAQIFNFHSTIGRVGSVKGMLCIHIDSNASEFLSFSNYMLGKSGLTRSFRTENLSHTSSRNATYP